MKYDPQNHNNERDIGNQENGFDILTVYICKKWYCIYKDRITIQYGVLIYFEVTDLSDEVRISLKKCIYSFKACCILCRCVLCFELHCKYGKVKITVYKFFQDQVQNIFLICMVTLHLSI